MRWRILGCVILAAAGIGFLLGVLPEPASAGTTPPTNLSGTTSYARFPTIAQAPDGTLCAAWTDNRDGSWNIYYSCSTDNGRSWSSPGRVYSSVQESLHPILLFSGTVPVFAWTDRSGDVYTIYQKTGNEVGVVSRIESRKHPLPSLALGKDGAFHMAFVKASEGGIEEILYSRRPFGGVWQEPVSVFSSSSTLFPHLEVGPDGILHLVWQDDRGIDCEIRYMTGTIVHESVTWFPWVSASGVVTSALMPLAAVSLRGDTHIVWTEEIPETTNRYLWYARFDASGQRVALQRMGGTFLVNEVNPYHLSPAVATLGNDRVCIAWNARPPNENVEDIFLSCSEDGGNTWSPPENLSRTPAASLRPSIAIAPDKSVHVVWQELVGDPHVESYRIYYTRWLPHSVYLPLVMRNAR